MANVECTIANQGFYYKPHLIKAIGAENVIKKEYTVRNYVGIDSQYFEPVINGMQAVVEGGTARRSKIPGIIMCGKTGTAQVTHGLANSVFVAFAPRDHPKIAIAVVVENSGEGAWWGRAHRQLHRREISDRQNITARIGYHRRLFRECQQAS